MKCSRLLILAFPLFLTACGLSPQQKADYAQVEHRGVSRVIYNKMVHYQPLSLCDIEALSCAHVPSGVMLRYLSAHNIVYYLSSADVHQLNQAGVAPRLVDNMLFNSRGSWWSPGPFPFFGADPFTCGPGFYGGYCSGFCYGGYGWGHHP